MNNNGIMYPITEQPDTIPDTEVIECRGPDLEGEHDCLNGGDRFLRHNNSPGTLIPPNWTVLQQSGYRGQQFFTYHCPLCSQQAYQAGEIGDDDNIAQYSTEAGTGRAIHGRQQPPQESRGEYLERLHNEAGRRWMDERRAFRRNQGRGPNIIETGAISKASGIETTYGNMEKEKMEIIEILRELNISYPQPEEEYVTGEYITTLINLIPKDYPKKNIQEPTPQELKEQAKKLYKDHPEHLKAALQQIDTNERIKKKHAAILRQMRNKYYKDEDKKDQDNKNKKRNSDDKGDDGAGSSSSRKKSKKNTEFKGPEGKFSLGKKTKKKSRKKKGGRRKKRTRRRKSRRRMRGKRKGKSRRKRRR